MELVKKEPWVQVCDCKPWALPALQPHHARRVHTPSYNQPPAYPERRCFQVLSVPSVLE